MKSSAAVAVMVATDRSVFATSSSETESATIDRGFFSRKGDNNANTGVRGNQNHQTISHMNARQDESLQRRYISKSSILTNLKSNNDTIESDDFNGNINIDSRIHEIDVPDLGILSNSRRLVPFQNDVFAKPDRLQSILFDSFNVMDRDGTSFYSICDAVADDEYRCSRCDTDSQKGTVGSFDCEKASCYEVDSRCPNNRISVCRYDTLERSFEDEISNSAFMPYTTKRCRKVETRLFKNNRARLPGEEWSWDFSYCLRYNITSDPSLMDDGNGNSLEDNISPNTCEMEVDGITCTSCQLQTVETMDPSSDNGTRATKFCASFDCANTLLGYSGHFCNAANLASSSIDYFVYRSLPCDDGCNLCGDRTEDDPSAMMMMKFRDSSFSTSVDINKNELLTGSSSMAAASKNCFEAQWEALLGPTDQSSCEALRPAVEKSCGCTPFRNSPAESITALQNDANDAIIDNDEDLLNTISTVPTSVRAFRSIMAVTAVIAIVIVVVLLRIYTNTSSQDSEEQMPREEVSSDIEKDTKISDAMPEDEESSEMEEDTMRSKDESFPPDEYPGFDNDRRQSDNDFAPAGENSSELFNESAKE